MAKGDRSHTIDIIIKIDGEIWSEHNEWRRTKKYCDDLAWDIELFIDKRTGVKFYVDNQD